MRDPFSVYNSRFGNKGKGDPGIDWEEGSLKDVEDLDEYYEGHGSSSNAFLFNLGLFVVFLLLAIRLGQLQIIQGSYYRQLADGNHIREQHILAPRGIIYDAYDKALVQNVPSFELVLTPLDLPKDNYENGIREMANLADFDADEIFERIKNIPKNSFQAISVVENLPRETAIVFEARSKDFPGFSIQNNPIRNYFNSTAYAHLLGYTGKISDKELEQNKDKDYLLNDYIGKIGVEQSYEQYLRGVAGKKQIEVDASGNVKRVLGEIDPQPGKGLYLNIDADLQKLLYDQMVSKNPGKKGAIVAVNPKNGAVLALLSFPSFNSNLFSTRISKEDYQRLLNDSKLPLLNRTINGTYPPGSTIKPVLASAALQEGIVNENTKIFDNGDLVVGNFHFRGWKPEGLGQMDIRSAIAWSSDIYFYTIGGGQSKLNISGLGPERIAKYDYLFGMGQKLGIDIQGEQTGTIDSPDWRRQRFTDPELQQWYLGNTYHISIGQGNMLATPLQVAMWTAAVSNGGALYKPYIVNKVLDEKNKVVFQNKPEVIRSNFIDPKYIRIVQEGMRQTVTEGTAKSFSTLPISSAGKTGTAQFDSSNLSATHAWFTGYAPYEDPQIVITVLVENGGEGSVAASPVAREALKWWAENRYNR